MTLVKILLPESRVQVFWGGSLAPYVGSSGITGGTSEGRTVVSTDATRSIRQDGYINRVVVPLSTNVNSPGSYVRFLLMRPSGSSFAVVQVTGNYAISNGAGIKEFYLANPIGPFRQGDRLGLFLSGGNGGSPPFAIQALSGSSSSIGYIEGLASGGETYIAGPGIDILVRAYGDAPVFALNGDSIMEGHNGGSGHMWHSIYHGGPSGERDSEIFYKIKEEIPSLSYQNFSLGSSTWGGVLSRMSDLIQSSPDNVALYCGVNDIVQGRTWGDVLTDMNTIRGLLQNKRIFLSEILPYSGASSSSDSVSSTIREWNANYAAWCASNGATLMPIWDAMGVVRPSTGFKDDLPPAYNIGDGHLTKLGVSTVAGLWSSVIRSAL